MIRYLTELLGIIMSSSSSNWLKLRKKQSVVASKNAKPKTFKISANNITTSSNTANEDITNSNADKLKPLSKSDGLSNRQQQIGKYLAIDCEFVGVGPEGIQSELARVSIVNYHGHLIFDSFVQPRDKVTDWRTWVSGVKPSDMKNAISFKEAQETVSKLIENKILVGHAIKHDLESLMLSHPKSLIRDTSRHPAFRKKYAAGKTPSLKKLTEKILGMEIQTGQHSSVEDAKATMLIYKSDKKEFERLHNLKFKKVNR